MKRAKMYEAGVLIAVLCAFSVGPVAAQYNLEVELSPSETGYVSVYPNSTVFDDGDIVTVTATPLDGYVFVAWEGDLASEVSSMSFTITEDTSLVAVFAENLGPEYVLTAYVDPSGGGSIVSDPLGSEYTEGTEVTLTAYAAEGYAFSGWSGICRQGLIQPIPN